jgi:hypothetical protein
MAPKKGNKNALKHGIFSQFVTVIDDEQMADMATDSNKAELAYARTRLKEAQLILNTCDPKDKLAWDYACRHWTEIIDNMLFRNVNKGETEIMVFETLLDAIRAANDKQHVVR